MSSVPQNHDVTPRLTSADEPVRAGKLDLDHAVQIVPALDALGESTQRAIEDASIWLGSTRGVSARVRANRSS